VIHPEGGTSSKIRLLVVAWLASQRAGKGTRNALASALAPYGAHLPDWRGRIDEAVDALAAEGALSSERASLRLTDAGLARARAATGIDALPPKLGWRTVKRELVFRHMASEHHAAPNGRDADALRAATLVRYEGLSASARDLAAAGNALVWKALGVESTRPLTKKALLAHVLKGALGEPRADSWEQLLALLAAKHVGARRAGGDELGAALARRWLEGGAREAAMEGDDTAHGPEGANGSPDRAPARGPETSSNGQQEEELSSFAARVIEAARRAKEGRFGDNKVYISEVHHALGGGDADLDAFKTRLVEAQRVGLVNLSRADLVEAMDPQCVRASETRYLDARFHFVRV
jgi:hypothetical protein